MDPGPHVEPDATTLAEIERLVNSGNKIEAIKLYREVTKTTLLQAKQAVDKLESPRR